MNSLSMDADVRLVQAMAQGDREALSALYDRHAPTLLALATRLLGAREMAEDLLHDVLIECWNRAADYDPKRGTVRTWLSLRVRSRALDRLRASSRARVTVADGPLPEEVAPVLDPGVARDCERVRRALDTLTPAQREVLELGYYEGLSSSEIAERLGLPMGTVKSRVAAALSRLRVALKVDAEVER